MDKGAIKNFAIEARKILMLSKRRDYMELQKADASLRSRKEMTLKYTRRRRVRRTEFIVMI